MVCHFVCNPYAFRVSCNKQLEVLARLAFVPDRAMVPRLLTRSALVIPALQCVAPKYMHQVQIKSKISLFAWNYLKTMH